MWIMLDETAKMKNYLRATESASFFRAANVPMVAFARVTIVTLDTNTLRAILGCALSLDAPDVFCI